MVFIYQSVDSSHFLVVIRAKSDRSYIERKRTKLSPVFSRHYENTFPDYIYCDLIEYNLVGDTKTPLLLSTLYCVHFQSKNANKISLRTIRWEKEI